MSGDDAVDDRQGTSAPSRVLVRCPFCGKLNRIDLARAAERPACGECAKPLLLDRPVTVTDADLERVIRESDVPLVVDFYADWCGPCKVMAPVLDELARERMGSVLVAKINTDLAPGATARYHIRGIPTLILFRNGSEFARQTGAVPRRVLDSLVDRALVRDVA